jgi:hypothetical protein
MALILTWHYRYGVRNMSVALLAGKAATNLYTLAALRALMKAHGVTEADPVHADALWVSMCDPDDLPVLIEARRIAGNRPVIMGGFEGYFGYPYLAWADAVVIGEGAEFIRTWAQNPAAALALPCVLTRRGPPAVPSYEVGWQHMPLLKVPGHERFYYLGGRGCKGKCAFCATAWTQPYMCAPASLVSDVVRYVESMKRGKLTLVSNDSVPLVASHVVNAQSVRVRDYLANPKRYKASMLHFGVEGWDEDTRKHWGKPISDHDLRMLLAVTAKERQVCELFFIVGYPGWSMVDVQRFADTVLDLDTRNAPQIRVKVTYLDPCPHTPLGSLEIGESFCDPSAVFGILNSRNKRIRVFPTRSRGRSAWRGVLHRSTPEEAVLLGPQPTDTNMPGSWDVFVARLRNIGLESLLTRPPDQLEARILARKWMRRDTEKTEDAP